MRRKVELLPERSRARSLWPTGTAPRQRTCHGKGEPICEARSLPDVEVSGASGRDVSELLGTRTVRSNVSPPSRPKLACACCEAIVQAEAPSRPSSEALQDLTSGACAGLEIGDHCRCTVSRRSTLGKEWSGSPRHSPEWVGGTSSVRT